MTFLYIDPGTGSVLVSVIIAFAAISYYYLKSFIYEKARSIFKRQAPIHKSHHRIVFYSEGGQYWPVFLPLIQELDRRDINCTYFTSDRNDPGLSTEFDNVVYSYIGEGHQAYFALNRLQADMVIMTTPGLDVLQLKRSKKVRHYCHIVHGLEDTSTYSPYGLDYYDSVLVNGEHQLGVIRQLEKARNVPAKDVRIIGSTYLDLMQEELAQNQSSRLKLVQDKDTVLLAPSWGEKGFLSRFGDVLIDKLLKSGFQIILRPHPQSWKSESALLKRLKDNFSDHSNLVWDHNHHGLEAMRHSEIMISDFSGIIYDYAFLFARPVIVIDFDIDPSKFDMNALPSKSSTLMKLIKNDKIGYRLSESELGSISEVIEKVKSSDRYSKQIAQLKNSFYCFPGEAGQRGADFVEEVLNSLGQGMKKAE